MSIWSNPPTATKGSFRKGDVHLGVFSIQSALNVIHDTAALVEDGAFGTHTEAEVKHYQQAVGLTADGVVGQKTQEKLAHSCIIRTLYGAKLPKGLLEGLVALESGNWIAAVNAKVSGGIDYGFTQRRCYGPPFVEAQVRTAARPVGQVNLAAEQLYDRHAAFLVGMATLCPFNAWELAVLAHNWPWAAQTYHDAGHLPNPNETADWVTWTHMTWAEWAVYYVHEVTKDVRF
jgi:hypothetical protein